MPVEISYYSVEGQIHCLFLVTQYMINFEVSKKQKTNILTKKKKKKSKDRETCKMTDMLTNS